MLIREKVKQAVGLLNEFDTDCWMTFTRESQINGDPDALGHQVGRFPHDGTALLGPLWEKYARKPLQPLEEGMVFTIEPRLTVPGHGVVTIEEMVVVTRTGAEWLSTPQKEILLIE